MTINRLIIKKVNKYVDTSKNKKTIQNESNNIMLSPINIILYNFTQK